MAKLPKPEIVVNTEVSDGYHTRRLNIPYLVWLKLYSRGTDRDKLVASQQNVAIRFQRSLGAAASGRPWVNFEDLTIDEKNAGIIIHSKANRQTSTGQTLNEGPAPEATSAPDATRQEELFDSGDLVGTPAGSRSSPFDPYA